MNFKKKVNGSWTDTPHYIHNTSTDTITTLPAVLYPNDTTATVGLKGQMQQTGSPTPQNPIQPSECGERTGNLFDEDATDTSNGFDDTGYLTRTGAIAQSNSYFVSEYIGVTPNTDYTLVYHTSDVNTPSVCFYDENKNYIDGISYGRTLPITFTTPSNAVYIRFSGVDASKNIIMLNLGSTPLPYEPYGYKIPISSASTTTPVYLGEVQTTRRIGKIDLSEVSWTKLASGLWRTTDITNIKYASANTEIGGGIAEKYTIHTGAGMISALNCIAIDVSQVSVNTGSDTEKPTGMFWYVLATETTGIVNEPIRKIGDYADTVSGITIPTITGKDTFDVETTLKPSEVTVNYKGWHPVADVHERENGAWT